MCSTKGSGAVTFMALATSLVGNVLRSEANRYALSLYTRTRRALNGPVRLQVRTGVGFRQHRVHRRRQCILRRCLHRQTEFALTYGLGPGPGADELAYELGVQTRWLHRSDERLELDEPPLQLHGEQRQAGRRARPVPAYASFDTRGKAENYNHYQDRGDHENSHKV